MKCGFEVTVRASDGAVWLEVLLLTGERQQFELVGEQPSLLAAALQEAIPIGRALRRAGGNAALQIASVRVDPCGSCHATRVYPCTGYDPPPVGCRFAKPKASTVVTSPQDYFAHMNDSITRALQGKKSDGEQ